MAPIRLGIVGGRRGGSLNRAVEHLQNEVEITWVCDVDEGVLASWKEKYPNVRTERSYERLLDAKDLDAVYLATPMQLHAQQAVAALRAGKHVLTEVIAATTLDECWELVEAVEATGLTYMMAENYCYMRPNMLVLNLVESGLFGRITHAEGGYVHDCRHLMHEPNGDLTWRGRVQKEWSCNIYPTHSVGPIAQWLGVNRPGGDAFDVTATFVSAPVAMGRYFHATFGADHPGARPDYWRQGDSQVTLIRTKRGAVIVLRVDAVSARPHNMVHYALQGERGAYLSPRHDKEGPLVWLEGVSAGASPPVGGVPAQWESLWVHASTHEHPLWQQWGGVARKAGHGGGDFFILADFVRSIRDGVPPPVDVYDAVTWSCITPLSARSVEQGGAPVGVPNFLKGKRAGSSERRDAG